MEELELRNERNQCKSNFSYFIKQFWEQVPGAGKLVWNWHLDVLANELQEVAERVFQNLPKDHDTIFNVSPGTSKSTICSILFPAWVWTRMPTARIMTASHTSDLVLDLSNKSRHVIRSEQYHTLFPDIEINPDQDTKGYFSNTAGGDRYTCTVAGRSPMGFHAHFQVCLPWETEILTDIGPLPIGKIVDNRLTVKILGFDHIKQQPRWQTIDAWEKNPGASLCRVSFNDGTILEATEEHPVYVVGKGYVPAVELTLGDEVISAKLQTMWQADNSHTRNQVETGEHLLRSQMSSRQSTRQNQSTSSSLQRVWQENRSLGRQVGSVLQQDVQNTGTEWRESSSLFLRLEEMRKLWQTDQSRQGANKNSGGVQLPMCGDYTGQKTCSETLSRRMSCVRENATGTKTSSSIRFGDSLLSPMCQQVSLPANDWRGQLELHSRNVANRLPTGISQNQEKSPPAGKTPLFSLWNDTRKEWQAIRCASHRLEQNPQHLGEFSSSLHVVSSRDARLPTKTTMVGSKTVVAVEREVRLPPHVYNLRTREDHNYIANGILVHNCDDPIDPKKAASEVELKNAKEFFDAVLPGRMVDKTITVMFLVMQRLHEDDPTGHLLEKSRREGAGRIKHFCLPAELPDEKTRAAVAPPELLTCYTEDGLMDPVRLPRSVLNERKADGLYAYAGQYLQNPVPPGGGLFKEHWFLRRTLAAPYHCRRVLYVDKAFTVGDQSCNTAATLVGEHEGTIYIGPVWVGKWEPEERDLIILCAAQQCRDRFGPRHEPTIVIEQEPAAGIDSYRQLAKKLRGFKVQADPARTNKVQRADPWASQCAAGNVVLVDDGTWNIPEWIREHCLFPLAKLKDRVDSAGGGFNWLTKNTRGRIAEHFHILRGKNKKDQIRIVYCATDQLAHLVLEEPALLCVVSEPEIVADAILLTSSNNQPDVPRQPLTSAIVRSPADLPHTASDQLLDHLCLTFADLNPADLQQIWQEPLPPYNRLPADLLMTRKHAQQIWAMIRRQRTCQPDTILICGEGGIPQSLALAVCDGLQLRRSESLELLGSDVICDKDTQPLNPFCYQMCRDGRHLVM